MEGPWKLRILYLALLFDFFKIEIKKILAKTSFCNSKNGMNKSKLSARPPYIKECTSVHAQKMEQWLLRNISNKEEFAFRIQKEFLTHPKETATKRTDEQTSSLWRIQPHHMLSGPG